MTLRVRVFRYDPQVDAEPRYQIYEIDRTGKLRVLDVLEPLCDEVDPTLNYRRYLCRDTMCNTCFAKVNGKQRLTCLEKVPEGEEMTIEPIDGYRLIRDLVVDFSAPVPRRRRLAIGEG